MPHNKTRLWVGLAIVAVTIPAVGTYYVHTTENNLTNAPILAAGRWDATNAQTRTASARSRGRDYAAELDALLAKPASTSSPPSLATPPGSDVSAEDDEFDVDPLPDADDEAGPDVAPEPAVIPNPTANLAPVDSTNPSATPSDTNLGGNQDQGAPVQNAVSEGEPIAPSGNISNSDVYRIVMSNLSDEDQTRFTQAYATMSTQQRADLLDSFRSQMQSNGG